jgi:hypothetical protein
VVAIAIVLVVLGECCYFVGVQIGMNAIDEPIRAFHRAPVPTMGNGLGLIMVGGFVSSAGLVLAWGFGWWLYVVLVVVTLPVAIVQRRLHNQRCRVAATIRR